jgi:5-methylthioadenosine/S-adenosylhomocysteine deaminase
MPPQLVLQMATMNGSKALGMEKTLGSIALGKKADIILVNLKTPRLTPVLFGKYMNLPSNIVHAAHGDDVDTVIVDGKIVVEHRQLKTLNEAEIMEKATQVAERLVKSTRI